MASFTLFVIIAICILPSYAIVVRPSSNPNYTTAAQAANSTHQPFTIYQTTSIKVHAVDNKTGHAWSSTFWPRVDEFSVLELLNSYNNSFVKNQNLTVFVEYQGFNTSGKPYFMTNEKDKAVIVLYQTVVVLLDKGNVVGVDWQDGCSQCLSEHCVDNTCGTEQMDGDTDLCVDKMDCNIKIYLAWSGRDANDDACRSIASSPASFSQYSLGNIANWGNNLWNDLFFQVSNTAPNPFGQQA